MNVLIVHCHPEPTSFNSALTERARRSLTAEGHAVRISDLYAEGFDPVEGPRHYCDRADPDRFAALAEQRHASNEGNLPSEIRREIERLEWSDLVIFQFPLWWHAQPAMLKGWFDRVFVSGGLYTSRMRYDTGYFRGRKAIVSVTSGAPEQAFGPGSRGGDEDVMLWAFQYSLHYMGFTVLPHFFSYGVSGHGYSYESDEARDRHLKNTLDSWEHRLRNVHELQPLHFPGWEDWDEMGAAAG